MSQPNLGGGTVYRRCSYPSRLLVSVLDQQDTTMAGLDNPGYKVSRVSVGM